MNALYRLVGGSTVHRFDLPDVSPSATPGQVVKLISVGSVVTPMDALSCSILGRLKAELNPARPGAAKTVCAETHPAATIVPC
jgi:hypothetical protein